MKKFTIFLAIVIIIVIMISYMYLNYQNNQNTLRNENKIYESYYQKESTGREVATLINKAMDNNKKSNTANEQNENNESNLINIDFKMLDNDETYNMETISKGGIGTFTSYYSEILFKCTKIEYHKSGKVKYMLFEQITI